MPLLRERAGFQVRKVEHCLTQVPSNAQSPHQNNLTSALYASRMTTCFITTSPVVCFPLEAHGTQAL